MSGKGLLGWTQVFFRAAAGLLLIAPIAGAQVDKEPFETMNNARMLFICDSIPLSAADSSEMLDLTRVGVPVRMTIYPAVQSNLGDASEMITGRFVGVIRNYGTGPYAPWGLPARVSATIPGKACVFVGTKPGTNLRRAVLVSTSGRKKVKSYYEPRIFDTLEVPWPQPHASWTSHDVDQQMFLIGLEALLRQAQNASGADLDRIREAVLAMVGEIGPWISCTTSGCCKIGKVPS